MYNLLIDFDPDSWLSSPREFDKSRIAVEYTEEEISERYKELDNNAISELKLLPTLFVTENETRESRIGRITDVELMGERVLIYFDLENNLPPLRIGTLEELRPYLGFGKLELSRTHWAIKSIDLLNVLVYRKYITTEDALGFHAHIATRNMEQSPARPEIASDTAISGGKKKEVFIVHGHDGVAEFQMEQYIQSLGMTPIILHKQASGGKTIIEKIEEYTNVSFGVVLYTPCDIGAKRDTLIFSRRARQNVVFEHGYLLGKLGRNKVAALLKGEVEPPNDISGIVYIPFDDHDKWKSDLLGEMRKAGCL
jgi:predicted nucleotide-binding protein